MVDVTISDCKADEARFNYARQERCMFIDSDLTDTKFIETQMSDCTIKDCILDDCQMVETQLIRIKIQSCFAKNGSWTLRQAFLEDVVFEDCQAWDARISLCWFTDLVIDRSNFYKSSFQDCVFLTSKIVHTGFNEAHLRACTFNDTKLRACRFRLAKLPQTTFNKCTLTMSSLERPDLSTTIFFETDLEDNYTGSE
jgi:uncharacterized protein YjbI with pentapeptide repeats